MDPRFPFLDWLLLVAESAACTCETVTAGQHDVRYQAGSAGQHDATHPTDSADPHARPECSAKARLPRLIPCSPALHAITD